MRIAIALIATFFLACSSDNNSTQPDLSSSDLAGASGDAGGKLFGATCASNAECATGSCFMGTMAFFCTMPCTTATQATDCPMPPTSGICNMRGFCRP